MLGVVEGLLQVLGDHAGGQAVLALVGDRDGLFVGLKGDDRNDGAEYLHIARDIHVLGHVVQNGHVHFGAVALAAVKELRALIDGVLNLLLDALGRLGGDQTGQLRLGIGRVAALEGGNKVHKALKFFFFPSTTFLRQTSTS